MREPLDYTGMAARFIVNRVNRSKPRMTRSHRITCSLPVEKPDSMAQADGVDVMVKAGKVAGVSCPDNLVPKFLDLGVQYFHGNVNSLLQTSSVAYLDSMRESAAKAGM